MSVCRRRAILLISFVFLLFFESVISEIHRAKPSWSKNVGSGANHHYHHHHLSNQHHKPHHHVKYSSGSNNVASESTVSSSPFSGDGVRRGAEDDDSSPPPSSPGSDSKSIADRNVDDDDRTIIEKIGTAASFSSDSDGGLSGGNHDGGGGIADRLRQQPKDISTWIYTLISASFVGLSGVLPLVLIPLEAGQSLREGDGYSQLKLFLSFAVGGLLGDVFLHLLPEAWNHVNTSEDFMWIGKWVLAGILSFLLIEKVMGEEDAEESNEDDNSKESESQKISTGSNCLNALSKENELQTKILKGETQTKKENIKISGYLNLFANCVDNFTHGLAIAGSYLVSRKVGIITTIAILLHEIPHEVGDFAILLRAGFDRWKAAKAQLLTATGGLLGAVTALMAESAEEAGIKTAWILPFTAGGFIYIALVTIVPELVKEEKPRESVNQTVCICAGILCMLLVTLVFE